jgi:hypothetical protein
MSSTLFRSAIAALATVFLISSVAPPALAGWERDRDRDRGYHDGRGDWRKDGRRGDGRQYDRERRADKYDRHGGKHKKSSKTVIVVPGHQGGASFRHEERRRPVQHKSVKHKHVHKKVVVEHRYRDYRPHRHHHRRPVRHVHRHYRGHDDAFAWLAFTAISIKLIDTLSEAQQYEHERAYLRASQAPIGQPIVWNQGGASGRVMTIRDGTSASGSYCREYQQTVTVGNRVEEGYGTACMQPDGAWQIVSRAD